MIASLITTLAEMIKPNQLEQEGSVERGSNQNYAYEVWKAVDGIGYYLKIRSLQKDMDFAAPRVIGSFDSVQDAINYFRHEYI